MMASPDKCYILFPGTHFALKAERVLKPSGLHFELVPTPRALSSSCGLALEFDCPDEQTIVERLREENVLIEGVFRT